MKSLLLLVANVAASVLSSSSANADSNARGRAGLFCPYRVTNVCPRTTRLAASTW